MNQLVVRSSDTTTKIQLAEISILIIENTAVSLTAALLCEMIKRKIKVIFCDEKRNPVSELMPCYGSHDTSSKLREQIHWSANTKASVWTEIVREKIAKQREVLSRFELDGVELLRKYEEELQFNDTNNREGHAAKVYFNSLFGKDFNRKQENNINAALNYGYSILLSAFNREINANGYITQLGIFHDNVYNPYNLSCDFMEVFRPLIDADVYQMELNEFKKKEKSQIIDILNHEVVIHEKKQYINNAISIYTHSILQALGKNDVKLIRFYRNEF